MKRKNNTGMICYPYEEIIKLDPFLTSYKKLILGGLKTNTTLFSGCTTGAPSQVDINHPESQELLGRKPACSFIDKASLVL